MVLTVREKKIVIGVGATIVLLALGYYVSWYVSARREISDSLDTVDFDYKKAVTLEQRQFQTRKIWKQMLAGGLNNDSITAESALETNLEEWAQQSGVNVIQRNLANTVAQSAKNTPEAKFHQIGFHLTGTGPLWTLSKLLLQIEKAKMPIRVSDLQIAPRNGKEGQDDLQFQLTVSTICLVSDNDRVARTGGDQ